MSLIKLKFNYSKLSPCGHLHIQIPGESYRGLTLAITEIWTRKYGACRTVVGFTIRLNIFFVIILRFLYFFF